ncbi:hypothetical protein BDR04DRAFT_1129608 [Suillus decipiens]|nr:hypothetical protein BDR04DRAFT_1129608 [Suillus decipiens]
MARILLGCIIGRAPTKVITCFRALLDFIYLTQYPSHDDHTLQYLEDALDLYHQQGSFGTTNNYNTEMFKCFHIDCAKEGWRASNFWNKLPQMSLAMFKTYLQHFEREEDRIVDDELAEANCPAFRKNHHCPSFSHQLCVYLNVLLDRSEALPRSHVSFAHLPFDKVSIWNSFKFGRDALENDMDRIEEWDWIKAKPGRQGAVGRFDMVVVAHTDEAESTGMKGIKIERLRVIFSLSEMIRNWYPAPQEWSIRGHLAYIEWYKLSSDMPSHHNMYTVHRPLSPTNGVVEGDIVPLHTIWQS